VDPAVIETDALTVVAAPAPASPLEADAAVLSDPERARLAGLARPGDAGAYAAAHALLRRVVGRRLAIPPDAVTLVVDPGLAPRVPGTALRCSLSHTDGLVLVAVADGRAVGVDVEAVDPALSDTEMAWIERELLGTAATRSTIVTGEGDPNLAARHRFLRRWTRNEAALKALGTGFGGSVDVPPAPAGVPPWRVLDLDVGELHVAALALAQPSPAPGRGCR
jgi:4'-phosphopantetheinyl transferase